MSQRPPLYDQYPGARDLERQWRDLASTLGARESITGRSVEGRPLWRFDLGQPGPESPTVMLSALIHGVEVIGSLALLEVVRNLRKLGDGADRCHFVLLPILNPDAFAANMERLGRGRFAGQRKNANRVDLNRNFPTVGTIGTRHPFAGSNLRISPHYRGPRPLSEPESRAVYAVASEMRPAVSVGFHSFGNMLLYPWGHTKVPNPRTGPYTRLTRAFSRALLQVPYRCGQAIDFYPTVGDLDDWLDHAFGTFALTVEVGDLDRRLIHPRRLLNAFCWMNPTQVEGTVRNATAGVLAMLGAAVEPVAP